GVPAELGRVFFRGEISAASPGLVADAPVADVEGITIAAGRAQVRHCRRARGRIAVLDPLIEIARRETADIRGDVRGRAGEAAEVDELVRAEAIRIEALRTVGGAAVLRRFRIGPEIRAARPIRSRTHAVVPVVAVGKTAARPADHGGLDGLEPV